MPLTYLDVKDKVVMTYFMFVLLRPPQKWEGTISKKRRSLRWFSRNSEVKATWTSLIGWPHKTSTKYVGSLSTKTANGSSQLVIQGFWRPSNNAILWALMWPVPRIAA